MKITAEPRSDQWNAEDFIGGPRTFTIAGVRNGTAEQKYDIQLEGETRVWRPPLTMLRVLLAAWGDDATVWAGRKVTLYQDPTVRFGKEVLGGIRISHLSHLDKPLKLSLTVKRGSRAAVTVQPLKQDAPTAAQPNEIPADVKANVEKAKQDGNLPAYLDYLIEREAPNNIINYVKEQA